jgi:hypothetical protein
LANIKHQTFDKTAILSNVARKGIYGTMRSPSKGSSGMSSSSVRRRLVVIKGAEDENEWRESEEQESAKTESHEKDQSA